MCVLFELILHSPQFIHSSLAQVKLRLPNAHSLLHTFLNLTWAVYTDHSSTSVPALRFLSLSASPTASQFQCLGCVGTVSVPWLRQYSSQCLGCDTTVPVPWLRQYSLSALAATVQLSVPWLQHHSECLGCDSTVSVPWLRLRSQCLGCDSTVTVPGLTLVPT